MVAGSLVAFTAYVWLLHNAPISLVSTYAYVNPAVAVALGALLVAEPITPQVLLGGAVIVAGVALVVTTERPRRSEHGIAIAGPRVRAPGGSVRPMSAAALVRGGAARRAGRVGGRAAVGRTFAPSPGHPRRRPALPVGAVRPAVTPRRSAGSPRHRGATRRCPSCSRWPPAGLVLAVADLAACGCPIRWSGAVALAVGSA